MRYMLDTNICIYLMDRRLSQVVERFAAVDKHDVVLSMITLAELRHGVERLTQTKDTAERAVSLLLTWVPVVPFDGDAAVQYDILAAAIRDRRRDALNRLARALSLGVTLVTDNEADFRDYPGLVVENWVSK